MLMSSIKEACSSRTSPCLHSRGLILKNSSTSPLWRLVPQEYSILAHNCPTSLPPLIKLRLTSKKFKIFINTPILLLWGLHKWIQTLFFLTFINGLGLKPKPLLDQAKFKFWCKQLSPAYIVAHGPYCIY